MYLGKTYYKYGTKIHLKSVILPYFPQKLPRTMATFHRLAANKKILFLLLGCRFFFKLRSLKTENIHFLSNMKLTSFIHYKTNTTQNGGFMRKCSFCFFIHLDLFTLLFKGKCDSDFVNVVTSETSTLH